MLSDMCVTEPTMMSCSTAAETNNVYQAHSDATCQHNPANTCSSTVVMRLRTCCQRLDADPGYPTSTTASRLPTSTPSSRAFVDTTPSNCTTY